MPIDEQNNVPADDVGAQVQACVYSAGVTQIKCIMQDDGQWTISVTYK